MIQTQKTDEYDKDTVLGTVWRGWVRLQQSHLWTFGVWRRRQTTVKKHNVTLVRIQRAERLVGNKQLGKNSTPPKLERLAMMENGSTLGGFLVLRLWSRCSSSERGKWNKNNEGRFMDK